MQPSAGNPRPNAQGRLGCRDRQIRGWSHLRGDALTPNADGYAARAAQRDLAGESDLAVLYAKGMQPSHPILQLRDFSRGRRIRRDTPGFRELLSQLDSPYQAIPTACH